MGMITHRKRPELVENNMPKGLGSLHGLWKTRDGRFVRINRYNDQSGVYTGAIYDEEGKIVRGPRAMYLSANHLEDGGLDLMIRQRGDETNAEDFLWPRIKSFEGEI